MSQLPLPKVSDSGLSTILTRWKSILDPVLAMPNAQSVFLRGVKLNSGVTIINHKLGRLQQGWVINDVDGSATIYRSAPFNDTVLTLTSSAAVTVNIEVF